MSSSAKHLQSQHPCEKGAATVKQHFCPVRLSLAFHSLQHNLVGLPLTNRKFHSCRAQRERKGQPWSLPAQELSATSGSAAPGWETCTAITPHQSCKEALKHPRQHQAESLPKGCTTRDVLKAKLLI